MNRGGLGRSRVDELGLAEPQVGVGEPTEDAAIWAQGW